MPSFLQFGLASVGICISVQFARMVKRGIELKADRWMVFGRSSLIRTIFPSWTDIPGVMHGLCHPGKVGYSDFQRAGKNAYIEVSMTSPGKCVVFLADAQAYKDLNRPREPFLLDVETNRAFFGSLGTNLLTLEGDEWKRHRKIAQRAFTEKLPQLVWTETTAAMEQLFELWDLHHGQRVNVPQIIDVTKVLALIVISSAALGQRLSWVEDREEPLPGFTMSFQKALKTVSDNVITRALTPTWAEGLTKKTQTMGTGYAEFKKYLLQMVDAHRKGGNLLQDNATGESSSARSTMNVFNVLTAANEQEAIEQGKGLTDEEVTGNLFLFLFAGHETTGNALAFSLGLLALYPQVQQEVYAQIKQVTGPRSSLDYADIEQLKLVQGVFFESLRMYPVVAQNVRIPEQDSVLSVARNSPGTSGNERENLFVPANSYIFISVPGIHYNPIYWPEPQEFRPSRFSGAYNKDAFVPFSVGRRTCIGQKFAETEGTAALAAILARYEVSVDATKFPEIPGESIQARRDRLLKPTHFITWTPQNLPLVFTRRE